MKTIAAVSLMLATSISGVSMMGTEAPASQPQTFIGTTPVAAAADEALPPTF